MNSSPKSAAPAPKWGIRGRYQDQDATMTLREGLAEYYVVNPGLADPVTLKDADSAAFFHRHDSTHVVFGTHTGPSDEALNDLLTLFGVDVPFRQYIREALATSEAAEISKEYANKSSFRLLWHALRLLPLARRRGKAMHTKWPWIVPEAWLDRPLNELRAELGIVVTHAHVELGLEASCGALDAPQAEVA